MASRISFVCKNCGSSDVLLDAWAKWNAELQKWVLSDTLTHEYCEVCESETSMIEVALSDSPDMLAV